MKTIKLRRQLTLSTALLSLGATPALAQGVLAEVHGTVFDPTGAPLPGATVTVTDTAKGWTRILHSNDHGEYELPQLEPDTISIAVEAQGFKRAVRDGITLQTGQQAQADFKLDTGDVTQTVSVNADASQVQAENGAQGTVIETRKIVELPLNGRNFFQLAQLVPNVVPPIPGSSLSFRGGFNVAGQPEVNQNYILDGIDNADEATMQPTVSPSVDGIQEFKVLTGVYSAEYGRYSGGQILITTKSGSNQLHGTAYEFYRTSALDAKNYFSPGQLPDFTRNQFGVTAGAPVKRDAVFVFGTYEGLRLSQQISAVATVPTAQERTGDLSDLHKTILNPATGLAYPGSIVPLNSTSLGLLQYYPAPNRAGTSSNYLFSETRTQNQDQFSLRVDGNLTKTNSLFVAYQYQNMNIFEPSNSLCGASVLPGFGCYTPELDQAVSVHDTQIFTPNLVNELRVGYNRIGTNRFLEDAKFGDVLASVGIPTDAANGVGPQSGANLGVPNVSISGYSTLGGATNLPQSRRDNTMNYIDVLAWSKGAHNFRFGADVKRFVYNLSYYQNGRGVFSFNGQFTGTAIADFLLGDLYTTSRAPGDPAVHSFTTSSDFFAQDEWHPNPRLTLSYGVRYELDFPEGERQKRISTFDPATGLVPVANGAVYTIQNGALVQTGAASAFDGTVWRLDKANIAPRIGLAFRPFGNDKTILRAGYGIFYDQVVAGNGISQLWRGIPFRVRQTFQNPNNSSGYPKPTPVATWSNPFPSGPTAAGGFTPNGINPDYRTAQYQQWSLTVDRELQRDLSLEVSYLGSKGTHLQESYNLNQPTPGPGAIQARRPFPQWGSITWVDSSGYSNFNSLSAQLQRRYSQGLTLLIAYTYSHSLDDAPYSGSLQNPQNLPSQYASSDFDVRHRLVASFTYELPFGNGHAAGGNSNRVMNTLISGWQANGIFIYQTGIPFTVTTSKDISNTGTSNYANVVSGQDPTVSNPTPARWFNTAAFSDVLPAGTFAYGTSGRNMLASDGPVNLDLGVYRRIPFIRGTAFQLRAEVYNTLNHPTFSSPVTNVEAGNFGTVTSISNNPRQTQFALKYVF